MATLEDFNTWLEDLGRFTKDVHIQEDRARLIETGNKCIEEVEGSRDNIRAERRIRIYTEVNCYSIKAVERPVGENGPGYLGCIATSRKPRAGETWTRGNDLADGPLDKETWYRILADIVSYEMVRVHRSSSDRAVEKTAPVFGAADTAGPAA